MATNRDLLKEAIADAKAVKETAIANAKAALEEAFTPFLKEKLSAKLSEMEEEEMEEEVEMNEEMADEAEKMEEVSLDELLAELEEAPEMEDENLYEAKKEEKEEESEEEMSIEDMDEDDLKSFIEDVIKDMVAAGELEAGHEGEEGEEEEEKEEEGEEVEAGEEEMAGEEEELDEEINLDEILAEEEMDEEMDEEVSLDELLAELEEGEKEESIEEGSFKGTVKGIAKAFNLFKQPAETVKEMNAQLKANPELKNDEDFMAQLDILKKMAGVAGAAGAFTGGGGAGEKQARLEEAYKTIEILKAELNEINVLNAKLLYTNKIFRNKSLTESQKVKVLAAFDKATTKQEAQLVYETLQESLKVSVTKAPIKESLGSASKVLGNAQAKPIIEVDSQFARWQKLAGLNKN